MFINADHKILAQDAIIEARRLEIIQLTKERDIIYEEIAEQRRWKTEVVSQKIKEAENLSTIESILQETKKALDAETHNFAILTDKQKEKLRELWQEIQKRIEELDKYEWKVIIDVDSENRRIKTEMTKKRTELKDLEDSLQAKRKEQEEIDAKNLQKEKELTEEKQSLLDYRSNLERREKDIQIKEKRLLKK